MKHWKQILIVAALIPFLVASYLIITNTKAKAQENQFYIKGGTGINTINPFKIKDDDYKGKIKVVHAFPLIEVGAGYQFADGIRVETVFDYYFLFHSKEKAADSFNNKYNIEGKTKSHAFFVNAYKDITTYGDITPFVGGGIGVSTLQEKNKGYAITDEDNLHIPLESAKSKKINRLAYKLTLGADYKVSDDYTAELSYNYFNLGYNKPQKLNGEDNVQRRRYGIHGIILGIRRSV
jgi:opacity protein-like surface antigen